MAKHDPITVAKNTPTDILTGTILQFNNELPLGDPDKYALFRACLIEFEKRDDKIDFYAPLLEGLQVWGIRHPDILHTYIKLFLGYNTPRVPFCKQRGHCSPFKFISDVFFEQARMAIAFANRTGGKTTAMAILNHLHMAFKPGCEVVSAGAILDQAYKAYKYFVDMHTSNELLWDLLVKEPTQSRSLYKNLSTLQVITGSIRSMNGPHPNKAHIDEVELMDWDTLQQGMSMAMTTISPETGRPIDSQLVMSSTRKYDTGTMQRLLDMAKQDKRKRGGFQVYEWCALEILEQCPRDCFKDPYYGPCPIHHVCKGRAHKCQGYYKIDDFIDKVILLDADTMNAEWFNLKPSRQVMVYGDYWRPEIHMIDNFEWKGTGRHIEFMGGIDFGAGPGHPFVYQEYAVDCTELKTEIEQMEFADEVLRSMVTFYLLYEYRSTRDTMAGHSDRIKAAPNWHPEFPIFADPSAKQARIDLEETYGIVTYQANNAVVPGIDMMKAHLQVIKGKAHYYIVRGYLDCDEDKNLLGTDVEFDLYKYRRFRDGAVNRKEPEQINDHGMDTARYVIATAQPYLKEILMPLWEEVEQDGYWFGGDK